MIRFTRMVGAALAVAATMNMVPNFANAAAMKAKPRTMHLEEVLPPITRATGSFSAINGVKRSFVVYLKTTWNGKVLTLREDFVYNDGEKDRKTWRFTKTGENTYRGTREDVIGETTLTVNGKKATFTYIVDLDPTGKTNKVRFRDTMILQDDGSILNTANVYKFGFPVAKVSVNFEKPGR
jgi:Protein of unknown function (DUF3833)